MMMNLPVYLIYSLVERRAGIGAAIIGFAQLAAQSDQISSAKAKVE